MLIKNILFTLSLILILPSDSKAVGISLVPDSLNISPHQRFDVDVVLDNSTAEGLTTIGIWLKYDRNLLNVVDTDTGNWVSAGINILDGPFQTSFDLPGDPGEFDDANDANTAGEIKWSAQRSFYDWTNIYPSGTFARITFQPKGAVGSTALNFSGAGTGGYPDTYVMNEEGQQILTSTSGGNINIIPEPATLVLFGCSAIACVLSRWMK